MNELLALIAEQQVGLREQPKGSNGGPDLKKFFGADDLIIDGRTDGYPWCAAFVSWCVQQWMSKAAYRGLDVNGFAPPRLARAFAFEDWGRGQDCSLFFPPSPGLVSPLAVRPERGDIVIYKFSHIGIVCAVHRTDPLFSAVEGNTNEDGGPEGYEVASRPRTFSQAKVFIRLPTPSPQPQPTTI